MASNKPSLDKCDFSSWVAIRDPIHGNIILPKIFFHIIDDPIMQRLREIKQLGLTQFVFPGAIHNRFIHCLGTAHVAKKMIESIIENTKRYVLPTLLLRKNEREDRTIAECLHSIIKKLDEDPLYFNGIVLAALLHDIGHIAFSHLAEEAAPEALLLSSSISVTPSIYELLSKYTTKKVRMHEGLTIDILKKYFIEKKLNNIDSKNRECLSKLIELAKDILEYSYKTMDKCIDRASKACYDNNGSCTLSSANKEKCIEEIIKCIGATLINNPLDADRLDFLLRDTYYSGPASPGPDIHRILATFVLAPLPKKSAPFPGFPTIAVLDKGLDTVELTLLARLYLYKDVYLHTVSLAYEAIAKRLLAVLLLLSSLLNPPDIGPLRCLKTVMLDPYTTAKKEEQEEFYDKFWKCLLRVTDAGITDLITILATVSDSQPGEKQERGPGGRLYDTLLDTENGPFTEGETAKKVCVTTALAARTIVYRRHWPFIYYEGQRAEEVIKYIETSQKLYPFHTGGELIIPNNEAQSYPYIIRRYLKITSTTIVQSAAWSAYDSNKKPHSKLLWIYSRNKGTTHMLAKGLSLTDINVQKLVVDEIDGKKYIKLLFVNPFIGSFLTYLPKELKTDRYIINLKNLGSLKQGKLRKEDYKYAINMCKIKSLEELFKLVKDDIEILIDILYNTR